MDPVYPQINSPNESCSCDANVWLQIISAPSATEGNGTHNLTGLEMGITTEASQGAIFKKLFTPKCKLSDPDSLDHETFFISLSFFYLSQIK